jgi:hypothetical protein
MTSAMYGINQFHLIDRCRDDKVDFLHDVQLILPAL